MNLPEPLTPPDCNLRGLRWMPLDVSRVLDSDLFLISSGAEFKAAFALWAKSWSQVPAGSLPNDERILAGLSAAKDWKRVREVALRGWILCADGRLYHPVIAEKALEAMGKREEHAEREENEQSRQQRLRARRKAMFEQLREHGIVPAYDTKTAELERLVASLPDVTDVTQSVTTGDAGDVTGDAPATAIEKDRTGQDITKTLEEPGVDTPPAQGDAPAPISFDQIPTSRGAAISLLMRSNGVEGCNASNPIVQEWAANARITDDLLLTAAKMAKDREVLRPGPNYLKPIVEQLLNPPKPKPRDDWNRSPKGIERKASELGIYARPGESHDALRERCESEIRKRSQGVAA
jgi:hypothetical protein